MKRIFTLILAITLCAVLFVSCTDEIDKPDLGNNNGVIANGDSRDGKKTANPDKANVEKGEKPDVPEKEDESLTELRKQISDSGSVLGVAYLGYNDGTFSDVKTYLDELGFYELYSFAKDLELDSCYVTGGDEQYLVVPAKKDATVKIYKGVPNFDTYNLDKGELVGEITAGKPFIVRGNESEIISNIILECEGLEYTPCLSGEDGELVEQDGLYDFSPYEEINEHFGVEEEGAEDYSYLHATWAIISERTEIFLELFDDGSANFIKTYSEGNENHYHGEWFADGLTLYLDMYDETGKLFYSGEYGIMYDGELLTLSLHDGDALTSFMSEQGYDSFVFYGVG